MGRIYNVKFSKKPIIIPALNFPLKKVTSYNIIKLIKLYKE